MACLSAVRPRQICGGARRQQQRRLKQVVVVASSLQDPYAVLGVSAAADEAEIKRAYRTKAKQCHPDVAKTEGSSMVFLQLTEAYDFLLGKLRGGHGESSQSGGWEWHDWYWNFRISRTWNRQQREGSASPPPRSKAAGVSSSAPNLREQLAGLRQRAAIRATKARNAATGSMSTVDTCGTMEEEEEEVEAEGRPQHSAPAHSHVHSQAHATVHAQTHAHVGAQAQVHVHVHAPEHALPQQHHSLHHHQQQQPQVHDLHTHHHVDLNLDLEGVHEHLAEHLVDASQQHQVQAQQAHVQGQGQAPPRRKFVAHSGTREAVRNQLAGLRRKSMMAADIAS